MAPQADDSEKLVINVTSKIDQDTKFFADQTLLLIRVVIPNEYLANAARGLREAILESIESTLIDGGLV